MQFQTLDDFHPAPGARVLVRVDFNVPVEHGRISDATRLDAAVPTIRELSARGCKVVLLAHFDRPKGKRLPAMSLAPIVPTLAERLGVAVGFAPDCIGPEAAAAIAALPDGGVLLLENTRFHTGEEENAPAFAEALAALGDAYVNDAFSAAHRAHASTEGLARRLPAYAGRAMQRELEHLQRALGAPVAPVLAVVGGAKVSTKLDLLESLVRKVDFLAVGGGMANTFLFAQGREVGKSLCEKEMAETVRAILHAAEAAGCRVLLPVDVVAATAFAPHAPHRTISADAVGPQELILDAGPRSVALLAEVMDRAKTLIWNGPLGAFETPPFAQATVAAAQEAAQRCKAGALTAVAGGGDTVAALNQAGVSGDFTYVSTAGGAFLEWMEGKTLPGVAVLALHNEGDGA